jgi:rhodanese-related sulfurtransferase
MKLNFKILIIILTASILMGLVYNYLSPGGVGIFTYDHKKLLTAGLLGSDTAEPKQIHLQEAFDLYNGDVIFLDAREPEDYELGHIKNAVNIYADDFETYSGRLKKISPDEPVVTYCGGTDCDLSIVLGTKLSRLGYKKIFVFFGGWNEWTEAGYPTEKAVK